MDKIGKMVHFVWQNVKKYYSDSEKGPIIAQL